MIKSKEKEFTLFFFLPWEWWTSSFYPRRRRLWHLLFQFPNPFQSPPWLWCANAISITHQAFNPLSISPYRSIRNHIHLPFRSTSIHIYIYHINAYVFTYNISLFTGAHPNSPPLYLTAWARTEWVHNQLNIYIEQRKKRRGEAEKAHVSLFITPMPGCGWWRNGIIACLLALNTFIYLSLHLLLLIVKRLEK